MATDEFTFPVSDPTHSPIDSPPLWRLSPATSPENPIKGNILNRVGKPCNVRPRNSCSNVQSNGRKKGDGGDEEEKMDMLWEDLNEELIRNRDAKIVQYNKNLRGHDKFGELGCVPVQKVSKKTSVVVIVKVLKKFFLLHHHSQQHVKKRPW